MQRPGARRSEKMRDATTREPGPGVGTLDAFSQTRVYFTRGENYSLKRWPVRLKIPKDDAAARAKT